MIDYLLESGISNALVSFGIAVVALLVGRFTRRPHLAYLLWLLVLVKLLMPSVFTLPVLQGAANAEVNSSVVVPLSETTAVVADTVVESSSGSSVLSSSPPLFPTVLTFLKDWLPLVWTFGILVALFWSLFRVFRFNRLIDISSEKAPLPTYKMAGEITAKLNLKRIPEVLITAADISPMVWWVGGRVRVVIPNQLLSKLESEQLYLVLAHELAHIKRKDHLVRWVEWLAAILFWWNPVVWLAKRNLRANEEICCDALVLSRLKPEPQYYAKSLLSAVEDFVESACRPPAMASEVNSGGYLIRRIHMILSNNNERKLSGKLQILVLFLAVFILPLGLINAQEKEAREDLVKSLDKLKKDVESENISTSEAKTQMESMLRKLEYMETAAKVEAAVKEGKISSEEADARLKALKSRNDARLKATSELKRVHEKLAKDVEAKLITEEEAKARMHELELNFMVGRRAEQLKLARQEIAAALAANKITKLEADAKLAEMKRMQQRDERTAKMKFETQKLHLALNANKISQMEAQARMHQLKRKHENAEHDANVQLAQTKLEAAVKAGKVSRVEADAKLAELKVQREQVARMMDLKLAAEKLHAAMKEKKISQEEAEAKMQSLKRKAEFESQKAHLELYEKKLKAAVEAKKLSTEEAKAKLEAIKKQIDKKKKDQ